MRGAFDYVLGPLEPDLSSTDAVAADQALGWGPDATADIVG
ncbi:hypothetical protein [Streptomyces sp. NPDC020489]